MAIVSIIKVYDVFKREIRDLMPTNYNDDMVVGAVILSRNALTEIKKHFVICGYVIINKKDGIIYPIDIQPDRVVIFEGTYNCFPEMLKNGLVKYNVTVINDRIWSKFFFEWSFLNSLDCFTNNGSFIAMCSSFLRDETIICKMVKNSMSIIEPTTYFELCEMTKNSLELSGTNFFNQDYTDSIKYLVDSLIHKYRINFTVNNIKEYTYNICHVINKQWEDSHE